MKRSIYIFAFLHLSLFLLLSNLVSSWGPLTHQTTGCLSLGTEFGKCFPAPFICGASAPDAFKLISPLMHDLAFAGFMVSYANKIHPQDDKLKQFALGYGAHLVQDQVGHHVNGYLTNGGHTQGMQIIFTRYQMILIFVICLTKNNRDPS